MSAPDVYVRVAIERDSDEDAIPGEGRWTVAMYRTRGGEFLGGQWGFHTHGDAVAAAQEMYPRYVERVASEVTA